MDGLIDQSRKERAYPELDKEMIIIGVKMCSVCGTDVRNCRHGHPNVRLPQIFGHEIAAEIVSDANDLPESVRSEDNSGPRIACGACFYCPKGQPIYCQNRIWETIL